MKKEITFDDLYQYIRNDLFEYGDTPLPRWLVMRLKGLHKGKFVANKNVKSNGEYSYKEILVTFKLKSKYLKHLMKTNKFKNEKHMINYIMVIVESEINNVVSILKKKEKTNSIAKEQAKKDIVSETKSKKYNNKDKKELSNKQKNLW